MGTQVRGTVARIDIIIVATMGGDGGAIPLRQHGQASSAGGQQGSSGGVGGVLAGRVQ